MIMSKAGHIFSDDLNKLAHLVGQFIQYWGFKKIHGEIWAHLWVSKVPIDSTTLVKRLNVSKALISLAVKDLLHYNVIQIFPQPDRRKILLIPNPNIEEVITTVLKTRELSLINDVIEAQNKLIHNLENHSPLLKNQRTQAQHDKSSNTDLTATIDLERLKTMNQMTLVAQELLKVLIQNNLSL